MSQKGPRKVLAYDLGGTKVAVGIVDEKGRVLEQTRVPVVSQLGRQAVLRQLVELGKKYREKYPDVLCAGIASAGPLHAGEGVLLNPINLSTKGRSWGKVALAKIVSKGIGLPVALENDAAAAILAERWVGAAKRVDDAMILTLGTGLGTGIIANGELVRAGSGYHPEAGHLIIKYDEGEAQCGCGNLGCAEAYLSGCGFERRMRERFRDPSLTGEKIAKRARDGDPRAREAFAEYARLMAVALHNFVRLYEPSVFIFTGSFAATSDLFLNDARRHLRQHLRSRCNVITKFPKLAISKLHNQAGLIGGGYIAFRSCNQL